MIKVHIPLAHLGGKTETPQKMSQAVKYLRKNKTGIITVSSPPVNALGWEVRNGLMAALTTGLADPLCDILILTAEGRTFMAGADIREFGQPVQIPTLSDVIARYESSSKPVIAAIHGFALGGGLELALVCQFRVAVSSAKLGLPEVKLGLLPGGGGTQRLPRFVGPAKALDMILTGEAIDAREACALGLLDETSEIESALELALKFTEQVRRGKVQATPLSDRNKKLDNYDANLFSEARNRLARVSPNRISPQLCIDAVEASVSLPIEQGLRRERELFLKCLESPERGGLVHSFFAERAVKKILTVSPEAQLRPLHNVAVIGAGTMGSGIAICFANAGIDVQLIDTDPKALESGMAKIAGSYRSSVSKGKLSEGQVGKRLSLIKGSATYGDACNADLVIEAVYEDLEVKKSIFLLLDQICKKGAILATNTSTLDIDEIALATTRPSDVVGMHFFSPAHIMKLVEIVRGRQTAADVVTCALSISERIKKIGVVVGVCYGFVGNRMLHQRNREAVTMVNEGASPREVDDALVDFGFQLGPFEMADLAGIDVGWRIREQRRKSGDPNVPSGFWLDTLAEAGRFGQKSGAGVYLYESGGRKPIPDPTVERLIAAFRAAEGITPRAIQAKEIIDRCLLVMVNEGAKILEEGVANCSSDIDVIWNNGYGFPSYRGGPMFWADQIGLQSVLSKIEHYQATLGGNHWNPAALLRELVRNGKSFGDCRSTLKPNFAPQF